MKPLIIIGAGGHGRVVLDAVLAQNKFDVIGFADENLASGSLVADGYQVLCHPTQLHTLAKTDLQYIIAIGDNAVRKRIARSLSDYPAASIIHPDAIIGSNVSIGPGCVILARTLIHNGSQLGEHVIVNAGALIDHDCRIGDFVHLSFGTQVGSMSHISGEIRTANGVIIPSSSRIEQ